jgi:hypothetical protein
VSSNRIIRQHQTEEYVARFAPTVEDKQADGRARLRRSRLLWLVHTTAKRPGRSGPQDCRGTGLPHRSSAKSEHLARIYRRGVTLSSSQFAMIDEGLGFQLVPALGLGAATWSPSFRCQYGPTAKLIGIHRKSRLAAGPDPFGRFLFAVPELTRCSAIQLNGRVSLPRRTVALVYEGEAAQAK